MMCAVHQPQYLPWLGYFDKMDRAGLFIMLDTVQFKKNEWQNRNRIRTSQGWQWLTVPVLHDFGQKIQEVRIDSRGDWRRKHWEALRQNYRKAPFFGMLAPALERVYSRPRESLSALNVETCMVLREALGITTPVVMAGEYAACEDPSGRLVDLCRAAGADTYLAGAGGAGYMDMEVFARAGVRVVFQEYSHPVYRQVHGEFVSHLSALDLLFNCGPESLGILRQGGRMSPR
jgi:hypothetical protein